MSAREPCSLGNEFTESGSRVLGRNRFFLQNANAPRSHMEKAKEELMARPQWSRNLLNMRKIEKNLAKQKLCAKRHDLGMSISIDIDSEDNVQVRRRLDFRSVTFVFFGRSGQRIQPVKSSSRNTAGSMKRLKAAFFNNIDNSKVDSQIGQDGEIFHPSPS